MPQHFIKIEIKGDQRNLPKEDGWFIVKFSRNFAGIISEEHFGMTVKNAWLTEVDWYLLPVPELQQPEQTESAELNRDDLKRFKMFPERAKELTGVDAEIYVFTFDQLNELFASQSPSKAVIMPTEEMIDKRADQYSNNWDQDVTQKSISYTSYRRGDKFTLTQCRAVDLRTILMKFALKVAPNHITVAMIDDYLKSPENK